MAQCELQGTRVLAEGIESAAELAWLVSAGVRYLQGYYFAKPALEQLTPLSAIHGLAQ